MVDGVVQSAPVVNDRIPGGAEIAGAFTAPLAKSLANVLGKSALPTALVPSAVTSTIPSGF